MKDMNYATLFRVFTPFYVFGGSVVYYHFLKLQSSFFLYSLVYCSELVVPYALLCPGLDLSLMKM